MDFIFISDLPFGITLRIEEGFVGGSEGSPLVLKLAINK
jgi:hypothetical protein